MLSEETNGHGIARIASISQGLHPKPRKSPPHPRHARGDPGGGARGKEKERERMILVAIWRAGRVPAAVARHGPPCCAGPAPIFPPRPLPRPPGLPRLAAAAPALPRPPFPSPPAPADRRSIGPRKSTYYGNQQRHRWLLKVSPSIELTCSGCLFNS